MDADDITFKGTICCKLYKRAGKPSLNAERAGIYQPGDELEILDVVTGETEDDFFEGIPTWYKATGGIFVWSGGVTIHHDSDIYKRKLELDQTYGSESKLTDKIDFQKFINESFVGGHSDSLWSEYRTLQSPHDRQTCRPLPCHRQYHIALLR